MSIEPYTDAPEAASYSNESLDKGVKRNPVTRTPEMSVKNFARTYETPKEGTYQKMMSSLGVFFGCLGTVPFLCCQNPYVNVNQGEVGLVGRFGALSRAVEPGSTYVNTWVEKIRKVSIRNQSKEVPSQDCLTRDNVSVNISSVIYYNIVDPQLATLGIENVTSALIGRTQTTLRDVIGSRNLQDVIERRDQIAAAISENISHVASAWGVHIESILIKDIHLPPSVSSSLSQAAEATRIGESKIIAAKAEVESAKLMRKAADILASEAAMQIRYLDAMQNMARSSSSKVIFMPFSPNAADNVGQQAIKDGKAHLNSVTEVNEKNTDAPIDTTFTSKDTPNTIETFALQEASSPWQ